MFYLRIITLELINKRANRSNQAKLFDCSLNQIKTPQK